MWVLLLVDAEEVPWRFGLRSDSGMMGLCCTVCFQMQINAVANIS